MNEQHLGCWLNTCLTNALHHIQTAGLETFIMRHIKKNRRNRKPTQTVIIYSITSYELSAYLIYWTKAKTLISIIGSGSLMGLVFKFGLFKKINAMSKICLNTKTVFTNHSTYKYIMELGWNKIRFLPT